MGVSTDNADIIEDIEIVLPEEVDCYVVREPAKEDSLQDIKGETSNFICVKKGEGAYTEQDIIYSPYPQGANVFLLYFKMGSRQGGILTSFMPASCYRHNEKIQELIGHHIDEEIDDCGGLIFVDSEILLHNRCLGEHQLLAEIIEKQIPGMKVDIRPYSRKRLDIVEFYPKSRMWNTDIYGRGYLGNNS